MRKLVIIPAYNEEKNIIGVIEDIKKNAPDYDYVVINDCSKDNTLRVCSQNGINVISLPINLGIGGCVQTGYLYAYENEYELAVQFDGDGQHNASEIEKLENCLLNESANMVIGSRFLKKEGFQSTIVRRIGIVHFTKLIRLLTGKVITDPTSGFRMADKSVIKYFAQNYPRDYPEPESVVTLIREGMKIKEVDVNMNERKEGESSIRSFKPIYYMIKVSLSIIIDLLKQSNMD